MNYLEQFDESFAIASVAAERATALYNGFYTLTFPDGSHKTFRVHTKTADAKFAAGQRILSLLIGPDNTMDYEGVGFVTEEGIKVWKRFRGSQKEPSKMEQYAEIIWLLGAGDKLEGYDLVVSRRCLKCNRPLTDPVSIERGIGPVCEGR